MVLASNRRHGARGRTSLRQLYQSHRICMTYSLNFYYPPQCFSIKGRRHFNLCARVLHKAHLNPYGDTLQQLNCQSLNKAWKAKL